MSTNSLILIIDKLVNFTTVYGKMLTICEKFRRRAATWLALPKKRNGWMCTMDERDGLYTNGVVGSEIIHMGYVE